MAFDRFKGILSLGDDINKVQEDSVQEGVIERLTPELTLDTEDKDLLKQKDLWIKKWDPVSQTLQSRRKDSENYWLGIHPHDFLRDVEKLERNHPLVDNLIFESLETFLPQATRKAAEPIVTSDETPEGQELSEKVRKMLIYLSDILNMRLKIKSVVRNWALYFVGVAKIGWNFEENEISFEVLRPQKFIMDPEATITEDGKYTGSYLGEWKKDTASELVKRFPKKETDIKQMVKDKMGTEVRYIEWWADNGKILFWTLKDMVLDKARNPHWNYPFEEERTITDEFGEEVTETQNFTPDNHFAVPQYPYTFLSVFNLGRKPFDETSLIEQNLGNQDLITKRYRQIDTNVDGMNGGWAISGELSGIEKEQARNAIEAFRDGRGVWIPQGKVGDAVQRMQGAGLPPDVFNQLQDARNEMRGIFGVQGSTPQGTQQEKTVRGKIIVAQQDQSRIGGGVTEYIEQFADRVYNLMVQMMYVYYDEDHIASIIGRGNALETITLRNTDLNRQLVVSVKEGSLIPKDPLTQANQAIDLFAAGAIAPVTLHERLDDPNPQQTVQELVQFKQGQLPPEEGIPSPLQPPANQGATDLLSSVPIQ